MYRIQFIIPCLHFDTVQDLYSKILFETFQKISMIKYLLHIRLGKKRWQRSHFDALSLFFAFASESTNIYILCPVDRIICVLMFWLKVCYSNSDNLLQWTKIDKKVQLRKAPTPCLPLKLKLKSTGFFFYLIEQSPNLQSKDTFFAKYFSLLRLQRNGNKEEGRYLLM